MSNRKKSSLIYLTYQRAYASIKSLLNKTKGLTTVKNNNNKTKKITKKNRKSFKGFGFGILGMLLLLVVMSIAYSSYIVWFGTTGVMPKVLLAPQLIFAAAVLIAVFVLAAIATSKSTDDNN